MSMCRQKRDVFVLVNSPPSCVVEKALKDFTRWLGMYIVVRCRPKHIKIGQDAWVRERTLDEYFVV